MRFHVLSLLLFTSQAGLITFTRYLLGQSTISIDKILANINHPDTLPGVVIASPSKNEPDYYAMWTRDAALTVDVLLDIYKHNLPSLPQKESIERFLRDHVKLMRQLQLTENLSGGPGEPKFTVDGQAFWIKWGRPQNDGPALRSIVSMRIYDVLHEKGDDELLLTLYSKGQESIIKFDLDYVVKHLQDESFDIWEELLGFHFYTTMTHYRALVQGKEFMLRHGDTEAADRYGAGIEKARSMLERHWDPSKNYIVENVKHDARITKAETDIATILAILHLSRPDDPFFHVRDEKIQATAYRLISDMKNEYIVNHQVAKGYAFGRYVGDVYDGVGKSVGHPWFLATNGMAEYFYRLARTFIIDGTFEVTPVNKPFLELIAEKSLAVGRVEAGSDDFKSVVGKLKDDADQILVKVGRHFGEDGSIDEQFNRENGKRRGAKDLTWSHASFVTATGHRLELIKAGESKGFMF